MAKGEQEEAARKLALLEGDRRAYLESSQAAAKQNSEKINELRKENKALVARLRSLKDPGVTSVVAGPKAVQHLDQKASEQIKKHNAVRHQSMTKLKRIEELEKALKHLNIDDGNKQPSGDSQALRELENRLDKAVIKAQEAQFIGKTYKQIIERLQQDRLSFDGRVTALEQTIAARRQEIARLEAMLGDASAARDSARADLTKLEQETQTARAAREQEKKRLQSLAEERRRQYEAMEKRLRLASVGETKEETGQPLPQDLALRLAHFEKAFRRLQDAAGVASPEEVLARFAGQSQTKEHLEKLSAQNAETEAKLKAAQEYEAAMARAEAAQYSGEDRAAAGRAQLAECEERVRKAEARLATARAEAEQAQTQAGLVAAGIDNLCDKLKQGNDARPAAVNERLALAGALLKKLVGELGTRQEELAAMHDEDLFAIVELPAHNVRVPLATAQKEGEENEDSGDDDEATSREAIKRQAASLVEAKTAKPKKKKGKSDDDDD